MNNTTFKNKRGTILLHVIAWGVVFSLPFLLSSPYNSNHVTEHPVDRGFLYLNSVTRIFWVGAFYFNAYILTPRYIYTKKYFIYGTILMVLFCCIMLIHGAYFGFFINGMKFSFFNSAAYNILPFILTITISTTYQMIRYKTLTDNLAKEKQRENMRTELSFLRSQISPHFVFNILNNMVALVRMKSEQLEPTIMKLSSLMQYMLYEINEEKVLLKTEIEYLQSYIDLQQQRFGTKVRLNITLNVSDDYHSIEPMLLIPFVENAFKHGVGLIENPQIDIDLKTIENILYFSVRNKYNNRDEIKDKTSGIGLVNVKRRLNLLYGNNQSLIMDKKNGFFIISLQLKLH